jgi:hypothetical protein
LEVAVVVNEKLLSEAGREHLPWGAATKERHVMTEHFLCAVVIVVYGMSNSV